MALSFGSGQTNGAPLLITATTVGTAQTLHTFPAGSATPDVVNVFMSNTSENGVLVYASLYDSTATLIRTWSKLVAAKAILDPFFDAGDIEADLIANGTITLRLHAETASVVSASARVDNQSDVAGTVAQGLFSGLVAAVQNANRFACPAPGGGVGTATEVNANVMIPRAGILRNLKAVADVAVGGGATVTVAVRINGVTSALSVDIANAQGTTLQSDTDSVAVAVGDLVTFMVSCDNAGAPAANFQAACEYVAA